MSGKREIFSNEFRAKTATEAIKGYKTITEISQEHSLHPDLTGLWKKQFSENAPVIFDKTRGVKKNDNNDELTDKLCMQAGKLQAGNEWLKKKFNSKG
ncbi:MAG: transposase [Ignavibacteria bacterium]